MFSRFEWPRWAALKELLRLGVPSGVSFRVDVSAFTFMALFIARLGGSGVCLGDGQPGGGQRDDDAVFFAHRKSEGIRQGVLKRTS